MEQEFTPEEYTKITALVKSCKDYECFTFDDLIIKGLAVMVVKEYMHTNPSKKFRTWLIDKGYVIEFTTNIN